MEEAPSPCKRSRTNDDAGTAGGDRLSALPDCLLHEIMSRMQARQVVQTCVLSTRWRHLWRSVPCINADEGEFEGAAVAAAAAASYSDRDVTCWEKFEDFMDILLSPGNVSIALLDKFRQRVISPSYERRRGYRWIRRGIKYDDGHAAAQGLGGMFQRQGFSSTTRSWRLRKLHLDNVCLDTLFSEHVRSGCPNLEDLELNDCNCEFLAITSGSLKNLVMNDCWCEFHAITSGSLKNLVMKECRMVGFSEITSPTLNNLTIDGGENSKNAPIVITAPAAAASVFMSAVASYSFLGGFPARDMTTPLAKASVRLRYLRLRIGVYLHILDSVSDVVTNLEVSNADAMIPGEWSATFPQFNNLRALELNRCDLSDGFVTLGLFLRNSPNLERLILRCCKYSNDSKSKRRSCKSKKSTPCANLGDVRCENLKLTEIIHQGEDIHQLVELLLYISENLPNNCIKLIKN